MITSPTNGEVIIENLLSVIACILSGVLNKNIANNKLKAAIIPKIIKIHSIIIFLNLICFT